MFGNCHGFRRHVQFARYHVDMSEDPRFIPPRVDFDLCPGDEFARGLAAIQAVTGDPHSIHERRSPFKDYTRLLTPEGGILICYRDQDRSLFLAILRVFAWTVATGLGGWLTFFVGSLGTTPSALSFALFTLISFRIVRQPVKVSHSVEIRADAMIVDGADVFYAEDIGDTWPELQMKDDDPDRMVICGICGTRFIEYMTANRLDENDRTPEVLAADLQAAIEQLWGRREVTFATAF
jgi:hypothetical protein